MTKVMKAAIVAALVMVSAAASAQFNANAGYVNSKFTSKDSKAMNGITVGVGYDMNIQGGFGLALGLNYTYAYGNDKYDMGTTTNKLPKMKLTDHYVDLAVRATYTFEVSDNFKVFGFAGPKFVYAVDGKTVIKFDDGDKTFPHYGKDGDMNPFDVKIGLGAGVNVSNFLVKVGYDWGMLDAAKKMAGEINHTSVRCNQFYVTVGYAF